MKKLLLFLFAALGALTMSAQTNLLENAGFENWTDGKPDHWTTASSAGNATLTQSDDAHTGNSAVQLTLASGNKRLGYQETVLKAGTYTFTFWAKSADGNVTSTRCGYVDVDDSNTANSKGYKYGEYTDDIQGEWVKVEHTFKLEADTRVALLIMMPQKSQKTTASLIVDDASLTTEDGGIIEGGGTGEEPEYQKMTVAEAQAAAANTPVIVEGTVMAVNGNSAVIGDETGYIFCYKTNTYTDNAEMAVGDKTSVEGKLSAYGGFNQINEAKAAKLGTVEFTYPEPTIMTGADLDSWITEPEIDYIQVRGVLTISGNYYNVNVDGATTAIGSIVYPSDALKEQLSNGSTYDLTGFAMYVSGSKYVNIVVTEAKLVGQEVEKKDIANTPETAYTVAEAHAIILDTDNDLSQTVYVKGKVSRVQSVKNNNAIYFISDDGTETDELEIYQGYGIDGENITSEDYLKAGDEVIVYGTLTDYNGTHEFNKGSKIYSLNGVTVGIENITLNAKQHAIYDMQGRRVTRTAKGLYIVNGKKVLVK